MLSLEIIKRNYSLKRFIATSYLLMTAVSSVTGNGPGRPMLISLPINVQASMPMGPPPFYDLAESAEEQRIEERVVRHNNNNQRDYVGEDTDSDTMAQPGFLSWNPGSQFMVLQLNDYIGARSEDLDQADSEEFEKTEDTKARKTKRRPAQEPMDLSELEDYRRLLDTSRTLRGGTSKKTKASSQTNDRKPKFAEQSAEEDGEEMYAAEPIVQYLKQSRKRKSGKSKPSFFDNIQQDESNDFNMKEWWGDY